MQRTVKRAGDLRFVLVEASAEKDRAFIHQQIKAFNDKTSEHHQSIRQTGAQPLDIMIRDGQDRLLGGLVANTYWGWLDVEDLWLPEQMRGRGYGRQLLAFAETEATLRGCVRAQVRTFSFQARGFYEKSGYRIVGRMDDYPPGQTFFWMRKDLAPPPEREAHSRS